MAKLGSIKAPSTRTKLKYQKSRIYQSIDAGSRYTNSKKTNGLRNSLISLAESQIHHQNSPLMGRTVETKDPFVAEKPVNKMNNVVDMQDINVDTFRPENIQQLRRPQFGPLSSL